MKKLFYGCLICVLFVGLIIMVLDFGGDKFFHKKEFSKIEGYEDLTEEEKSRIENISGEFQIGEIEMYSHTFNYEGYDSETDALKGQKMIVQNINNIELLKEHYQAERVLPRDAEYYWRLRYVGSLLYLGEKSVVTIELRSLESDNNTFDLIVTANGSVFLLPGARCDYGDFYLDWGIYSVSPCEEKDV